MFRLFLTSFLLLFALSAFPQKTQQRTKSMEKLQKEQRDTKRQIKETTSKLKTTTREANRQLNRLEALRGDMKRQNEVIDRARRTSDSVQSAISRLNDSIASLDSMLVTMRKAYGSALRGMQTSLHNSSALAYLLSSESFEQGFRRLRYLRQFSKWRRRKAADVVKVQEALGEKHSRLSSLGAKQSEALQHMNLAAGKLKSQQDETERLVASLRKQEGSLRAALKEHEARQRKLDSEIDRLIQQEQQRREQQRRKAEEKAKAEREAKAKAAREAEEQKRKAAKSEPSPAVASKPSDVSSTAKPDSPAAQAKPQGGVAADPDAPLSGSFENNKGRLLFPVSGRYNIVKGFGRQPHPELRHVETDNSGIDIEAIGSASARAIFNGTVSAIFQQPGFGNIVMIRHGKYISIYAGLSSISVQNGQQVKTGQTIGSIRRDPENDNRAILHFEIRQERTKLNPLNWVK